MSIIFYLRAQTIHGHSKSMIVDEITAAVPQTLQQYLSSLVFAGVLGLVGLVMCFIDLVFVVIDDVLYGMYDLLF